MECFVCSGFSYPSLDDQALFSSRMLSFFSVIEFDLIPDVYVTPSFYAPSFKLRRFSWGCYGVGHTAWRHPGDMRGTVVGKKGRFKSPQRARGGDV
jgi:hypothetical protein